MNSKVGIAVAVGIAVIIGAIAFQINETTYERSSTEEYYEDTNHADNQNVKHVVYPNDPQTLRGLTINKDKYLLGEKVFLTISGIPMGLKDSLLFYTPQGKLYEVVEFDGDKKSFVKHYFTPSLKKSLPDNMRDNLCNVDELIGEWTVLFRNLPNERLTFQILNEYLPYSEEFYTDCNENPLELPFQPSLGK